MFLSFCFTISFAQLDREHWFAPMVDRTGNPEPHQYLYFSTNQVTPFLVTIYNNNTVIGTVTISKGNPQKFAVPRDLIITGVQTDLFKPITKGLYVKADRPFFANLRFSVYNHAEIITSKGLASKGNKFYAAMAPISVQNPILNFMTSVLATEDNTQVTVSGYNPLLQFSDGLPHPTISFTLNKGQSYIIDGNGSIVANSTGFIGAKIVSDKPVVVTNGNFNGQYAGNYPTSSDILMDQSLPTNQLGSEFALVKGNGSIGSNMEGVLVVAAEDNTQIFVNNEATPVATINEGKFFLIPETKYQLQGSGHYNLYIKTTKNAYVYQILAGDSGASVVATGGFNFIPALNCYLPKAIDEIGLINENYVFTNGNPTGLLNIPTKLNMITETGATVLVNGVAPPATTGPFPMTGTPNWVTYGVPNVTGNITITSTKAITAGINAGSDAIGYGGFFAGFPTSPFIIKTSGDCIPGIILAIDPSIYETYQWYLDGVAIPGATNSTIAPTQPGYYTTAVTIGSCPALYAEKYKVLNCLKNTTANYAICGPMDITPTFTSSTQIPVPSTLTITTSPTKGSISINPTTGVITYTPNAGASGNDTFVYQFCGNNVDFPDCESVTVSILIGTLSVNNATLKSCSINGLGTFNLTSANVTAQSPVNIKYYPTLLDAQNENAAAEILVPNAYVSAAGSVFATVKTAEGCKQIAEIFLELFPVAIVADYNGVNCDDNFDGIIPVDLSSITPLILPNFGYFNVKYYTTLAAATAGGAGNLANNWSYTTNTTIYIRVESPDGCPPVIKAVQFNFGNKVPLLANTSQQAICDDDIDGIKSVDLSTFSSTYTNDPAVTITYYNTLANAQTNTNAIASIVTVTNSQTFYLRLEKLGFCPEIAQITVNIKTGKKSTTLFDQIICQNVKNAVLDAGSGFDSYLWSTGETTASISVGAGNYWVDLTFNGCVFRQYVTVTETPIPKITGIDVSETGNVTITASGGTPPYEYSIDNGNWQSSPFFINIPKGLHMAHVRDVNNCEIASKEFIIFSLINVITPNGDGINDVLNYSDFLSKEDVLFEIYDRYGALVFIGNKENRYIWDGTILGRPVPTATYWYILNWREVGGITHVKYSGWILVKHRNNKFYTD